MDQVKASTVIGHAAQPIEYGKGGCQEARSRILATASNDGWLPIERLSRAPQAASAPSAGHGCVIAGGRAGVVRAAVAALRG